MIHYPYHSQNHFLQSQAHGWKISSSTQSQQKPSQSQVVHSQQPNSLPASLNIITSSTGSATSCTTGLNNHNNNNNNNLMSTSLNNAQLPSHLANSSQNCVNTVTSALHPQNFGMSQSLHDTGASYENSSNWTNTASSTGSHGVTKCQISPTAPVPPRNLKKHDMLSTL